MSATTKGKGIAHRTGHQSRGAPEGVIIGRWQETGGWIWLVPTFNRMSYMFAEHREIKMLFYSPSPKTAFQQRVEQISRVSFDEEDGEKYEDLAPESRPTVQEMNPDRIQSAKCATFLSDLMTAWQRA